MEHFYIYNVLFKQALYLNYIFHIYCWNFISDFCTFFQGTFVKKKIVIMPISW